MTAPSKSNEYEAYTELSLQRLMVSDRTRTEAFADALEEVVGDGDRVIDVGTGTGLLAMLAARAGATEVLALDTTDIAVVATDLIEANYLQEVVTVVQESASEIRLKEPVDLIVSEWLGHFAFTEDMLRHVLECRDHNLKSGGTMMPSAVDLLLAPVDSEPLYVGDGPGFWDISIRGIDFSFLERAEIEQARALKTMVQPEELLAPEQALVAITLDTATMDDVWQSGELTFEISRDGEFHGFAGWFSAQLSPSVVLDTAPGKPMTHWQQTYFPCTPLKVKKGQELTVRFAMAQHPEDFTAVELRLEVAGQKLSFMVL